MRTNPHFKEVKEQLCNNISRHGCHIAIQETDGYIPQFGYSIGLFENYNYPEIITFGLSTDLMHKVINRLKQIIGEGEFFMPGHEYGGILKDYNVRFLPVRKENFCVYAEQACWYYGSDYDFPMTQMIWPDKNNHWPWESSFEDELKYLQPLLDRNDRYKFLEPKNLFVYTSEKVLEGQPILNVMHHDDGSWEFHTAIQRSSEDVKYTSLGELVERDPTLNDIHFLNYGYSAKRDFIGGDWVVSE